MERDGYEIISFSAWAYDKHFIEFFNENRNLEIVGKIHSIYSRTINFLDNKDNMYTIGSKSIDNSPFTLRIDNRNISFEDLDLEEGNRLFKMDNSLIIEDKVRINLGFNCILWNPNVEKRRDLNKDLIMKNIGYFNDFILEKGSNGGCRHFYLENYLKVKACNPGLIEKELSRRIEVFLDALNDGNIDEVKINSLIGFGIGLTPSGDDFLTGFLSTLNIISTDYSNKIKRKLINLIHIDKISTTDVSKQMLSITLRGESREYILSFINAFLDGDKEQFLLFLERLLNIGSSSGTDLAVGVVTAFILLINNFNMEE
ncbi:DUF2877 domain-containing protein [Tissierella carlieri]|uniref:DUF2877 domain-containing protein n=1 Tax=Tissierella carlieri TaxID=689904 RepID=A0ABT1S7G2_9FIRM|nr:DUF2877 domain-containing protein [Tissierella carlieri]MBU5312638.1 DUF2877 domain-containing protein [Tissierella carlieri]MCQ4922405.1 DUF2877 domain-containing protein [Tissierella carlieri]